jgi:hypothetical protein
MEAIRCSAHGGRRRSRIITQTADDAPPDSLEKLKTLSAFPRTLEEARNP